VIAAGTVVRALQRLCARIAQTDPEFAGTVFMPHDFRSYVTHLTEDGVDRRFIQSQVGHECDSSTAVYTHVSDDFMNTALRRALGPALDAGHGIGDGPGERR
jgi:site-specific recombinase XerD